MNIDLSQTELLQVELYKLRAQQLQLQLVEIQTISSMWFEKLKIEKNVPADKYKFDGKTFIPIEEPKIVTPIVTPTVTGGPKIVTPMSSVQTS